MQPGDTLAHYTVVEKIGQGGMGEVFRARDTKLDRDVAIKILPPGFDHDPERLARFQREARTLAALQHPNVASIYGLETAGGQTFLVMELVVGEDLSQRLVRGALPIDRVLEIAGQIATGLEAAHDKGIVHRDLKPANIKLGSDGAVKILDFGLARAYEGDPEQTDSSATQPTLTAAMTGAGVILGTAAYMSPEQARGKALDKRTDIFSFGVVLYEMLTGARPFGGETLSDTLASVLKEQPDRGALPADTPAAVRLLLDRCLEKDARKRLRDIGEARLIMAAVQGGDATASLILGRAGAGDTSGPTRLRPREMAAWALGLVAVAVLGIGFLRGGSTPPTAAKAVHNLSVPIQGDTDLRFTHGGLVISPDGSRIAYINGHKLYVRRLDSWDPIEIPQSEGASSPFWSPDGQWLAFAIDRDLLHGPARRHPAQGDLHGRDGLLPHHRRRLARRRPHRVPRQQGPDGRARRPAATSHLRVGGRHGDRRLPRTRRPARRPGPRGRRPHAGGRQHPRASSSLDGTLTQRDHDPRREHHRCLLLAVGSPPVPEQGDALGGGVLPGRAGGPGRSVPGRPQHGGAQRRRGRHPRLRPQRGRRSSGGSSWSTGPAPIVSRLGQAGRPVGVPTPCRRTEPGRSATHADATCTCTTTGRPAPA